MTLGERICKLRAERNMSQGDLAEALEVSRQSISKWETNGSVPELDKLVKLSELFGVSLDELILDKKPAQQPPAAEPQIVYVQQPEPRSAGKTVGIVLLCFSALLWLMIALFGDILGGLVLAAPFVGCGLVCLLVKKYPGLWCGWILYLFVDIYLRFASGINWQFIFLPQAYDGSMTLQLIVAWSLLAIFATLTVITALYTKKAYPGSLRGDLIGAVSGFLVYGVTWFLFALPAYEAHNTFVYSQAYRYVSTVSGWVRGLVLTVALTFTVRLLTALGKKLIRK